MKKIVIDIPEKNTSYPIFVGANLLSELATLLDLKRYAKIAVITDTNVAEHWLKPVQEALGQESLAVTIDAGDDHKTIDQVTLIWQALANAMFDRKSLVINVGGGMVGDLGGLAASTYMRGIDFVQVPTTLLAQVDASVGGKVAVNFVGIKNLIGTFNQPTAVIIDTQTLATLPKREYLSGFGEILKHGLIADKNYFEDISVRNPNTLSPEQLAKIVEHSVKIKAEVVMHDQKETGERKKLNFGHTIGHALESLSHGTEYPLLHGEAVSLGMIAEAAISNLTPDEVSRIRAVLNDFGLPTTIGPVDHEAFLKKVHHDKKSSHGINNLSLLDEIGVCVYDQRVDDRTLLEGLRAIEISSLL